MDNPNCYNCKWRGTISGEAHSCCRHPEVRINDNPMKALHITGDELGRRRGWFSWPANLDPVWLLTCAGFEEKGE